ncbi:ImmA/IrrE family metallo-endopeptidase [Marinobacter adhaerens]|uniref:ImmA/IrrE family metallo-endopeptidase n=1 Tax=Marinobacter adhaerens TaxID=1033846 RepID=UPI001E3C4485|nr:ImmA/IrrE family metallo-endopeptidase [Marinobacter adhaerens]MCD1649292.1 ImmA/IrrE family metallo-endopeptidase [Marinobacter adhaerens]
MNKMLSASRQAYKNPLAHMEELEREHWAEEAKLFGAKKSVTSPSPGEYPGVLHNPYLTANNEAVGSDKPSDLGEHVDQKVAELPEFPISKSKNYSRGQIQETVRRLHRYIWKNQTAIWGYDVPTDPVEMLDVRVAAKIAGFEYQELGGIGIHQTSFGDAEVAGLIDESSKTISISHQQKAKVRRFTAAHEIGHAMLHEFHGAMHRDRSSEIMGPKRDRSEQEADEFATLFLMPAKLVEKRFLEIFYTKPFILTNETAFALGFSNTREFFRKYPNRRSLAKLLASTERFNFINVQSLADQFGVSTEAMAIRLEELELIE